MPCCRIDSLSSSSTSRATSFRGCNVLGTMLVSSIWCTFSPASDPSLGVTTEGVPMSAPRPLPKPERAIAPEATGTDFSTQTAKRQAVPRLAARPGLLQELSRHCERALIGFAPEKQLKKVLTPETKIQYHDGRFQKRQRTFAR